MFSYQLLNYPETFSIDESRIAQIFHLVWDSVPINQNGILNIALLSDDEIQALNRDHRGIDSTTDVLSFHYSDDFSELDPTDTAGEIILSESRIISQALEHGHTSQKECEILVLHSILHIIGFDHETDEEYAEMWWYEEKLRKQISDFDN